MNLRHLSKQFKLIRKNRDNLNKIIGRFYKIILLGNGGSNSIASHIANDYSKFLNKKTLTFSDSVKLTCYINDYGMENSFVHFLDDAEVQPDALVILISSSGESDNVINSLIWCEEQNIEYLSLTGFDKDNKMRTISKNGKNCLLDFWVSSKSYGVVENTHQIFLHSILDI